MKWIENALVNSSNEIEAVKLQSNDTERFVDAISLIIAELIFRGCSDTEIEDALENMMKLAKGLEKRAIVKCSIGMFVIEKDGDLLRIKRG